MAWGCVACSTERRVATHYRNSSARTMIGCTNSTNGRRTCGSSTWKRSRRCRTPRSRIHFVERLIGTIRREWLDHTFFWTAADLEEKLLDFQSYYNGHRAHAGLEGRTPEPWTTADGAPGSISSCRWQPHCRGLSVSDADGGVTRVRAFMGPSQRRGLA